MMIRNKVITVFSIAALVSSATVFGGLNSRTANLEKKVDLLNKEVVEKNITPIELYAHGPAIVSSPSFSLIRPEAHELVVSLSKINRDLEVLNLRRKMDKYAGEHSFSIPGGPTIVLSGGVEGQFLYYDNYSWSKTSRADIDLTRAELDITGEMGPWVTATIIAGYDKRPGYSSPGLAGSSVNNVDVTRKANSRFQIDRAFLTAGNLDKSPLYATIGQIYAPFGAYNSFTVSSPATRTIGRTKGRMAILGYSKQCNDHNFNAQIFGLAGSTLAVTGSDAASSEIIKHGGFDVNYKYEHGDFRARVGAGVLGNLAESDSMQEKIFGGNAGWENIYSKVLGYDGNINLRYRNFGLIAEYVTASTAFDVRDVPFNGSGARPSALSVSGGYSFNIKGRRSTLFAGWNDTRQALALSAPKHSYLAGYSLAWIKNSLASIEYKHDVNYGRTDNAIWPAGQGSPITVKNTHANTVTMQVGLYF